MNFNINKNFMIKNKRKIIKYFYIIYLIKLNKKTTKKIKNRFFNNRFQQFSRYFFWLVPVFDKNSFLF